MKYFSAFTGVGGFELGLPRDWVCVGMSEIDKWACMVLRYRFPGVKNYGDIEKINYEELPDFDVLIGGFPCQPFSIAGKRKGFDDNKSGTLFWYLAKLIAAKQPRYIILENVKGILSLDNGDTFREIAKSLNELGYYVNVDVYNATDFGIPQNRERVFITCLNVIKSLKEVENTGDLMKTKSYVPFIESFLFGILLKNLGEVKKLQETGSKDWVLSYILSKEIHDLSMNGQEMKSGCSGNTIRSQLENLLSYFQDIANQQSITKFYPLSSTDTDLQKESPSIKMVDRYSSLPNGERTRFMNTDMSWKNISAESLLPEKSSIISTWISRTMPLKTYSYAEIVLSMLRFTELLRSSFPHLWKKVLLDLIVMKRGTNYARIIEKNGKYFTESGDRINTDYLNKYRERVFIFGTAGGERPREIFFERKDKGKNTWLQGQTANTITRRYWGGKANGSFVAEGKRKAPTGIENLVFSRRQIDRVYGVNGVSPTLHRHTGGEQKVKIGIPVRQADGRGRNANGRRFKGPDEPSFTLQSSQRDGVAFEGEDLDLDIRYLTPRECERLMGWPDDWTQWGTDENGDTVVLPDNARYSLIGNGVVPQVVWAVIESLLRSA